jgi:hypothetical protein
MIVNGHRIYVDPARVPGYAVSVDKRGQVSLPPADNPALLASTIERAQITDTMRATRNLDRVQQLTAGPTVPAGPVIDLLKPGESHVDAWIEEVETKLLEGE